MTEVDSVIFSLLDKLAGNSFLVDGFFIFLSKYLIYILTLVFVIYAVRMKNWKERAHMLALGTLSVILSRGIFTPLIRFFIDRPRPFAALNITPLIDSAQTGSFPSGHLAFIAPLAIALWYINKRAGAWSLIGLFLIGVARVAVGVHWPTDILGGFLVGVLAYAIVRMILKDKLPKNEESVPAGAPE